MEEKIINTLLNLCNKALSKNEMPVSALIVKDNKIIAKAYNKKNLNNNPLKHAEIICLEKAYKKLRRWNLSDCVMYVSLAPCDMCKLVIEESRIKKVYYILEKGKITNKYYKTKYEQTFVTNEIHFKLIIDNFFKNLRKKL